MPTPLATARLSLEPKKTQADIARAMEVTQPTVWAWENGVRLPKYETAEKLAPHYGLDTEEVMEAARAARRARDRKAKRRAAS